MMTVLTRASNNQPVTLGNQIASSGEGEVWETNLSGILAKIYHNPIPERIEKLKAMLANPPIDPMASQNHISIAFPQDLLKDGNGAYIGFLMPAVRGSRELTTVYNPRLRQRKAPGFNWYYLHVTALNTAWIVQALHEKGYVLGDIKPQNILVNDRALVAVIDTDSFQVCDTHPRKVYRCTVGSEGFTPVELLGQDFSTTDQTEIHDRFRLAVLIHYLLFGYHPFSGEWGGSGDSPDQTELIRKGFWYGSQNSLIRPSQNTIPLDVVHPEIKRCFLKCFNDGHTSPHLRPTAEDWHRTLEVAINDLTVCGKVDSHHYSRNYGKCCWCERKAKLSVDIFPGSVGSAKMLTATGYFKIFAAYKTLELVKQAGQKVTVVGRVVSTHDLFHNCVNVLFINFEDFKNSISGYSPFKIVIFSEGLQNLSKVKGLNIDDFKKWVGEYLQITGILETHQDDNTGCRVPQIVLKEAAQIKLITKYEASKLFISVSSQTSSTAVKIPTTPSTAAQNVSSSIPLNQTSKQSTLQPSYKSPFTSSSPTSQSSLPPQVLPQYRHHNVTQVQSYQNPPPLKPTSQSLSNVQHKGIEWGFLFQWILASSVAWSAWSFLSYPGVPHGLDTRFFIFLCMVIVFFFGSAIGAMQWAILRQRVSSSSWWVLASTVGWLIGLGIDAIVLAILAKAVTGVVIGIVLSIILGATIGTLQSVFLDWQGFRVRWWVLISTVSWTIGLIASSAGHWIIGGIVFSLVTGIALDWLLRNTAIQRSN